MCEAFAFEQGGLFQLNIWFPPKSFGASSHAIGCCTHSEHLSVYGAKNRSCEFARSRSVTIASNNSPVRKGCCCMKCHHEQSERDVEVKGRGIDAHSHVERAAVNDSLSYPVLRCRILYARLCARESISSIPCRHYLTAPHFCLAFAFHRCRSRTTSRQMQQPSIT